MSKQTLQEIIDANPDAETFRFGEDKELSQRIIALVRAGKKTATCEAMRAFTEEGDAMPMVGRRDVALNWDGTPAVMVETMEVKILKFNEMDAARVADMGEFRDLNDWRRIYSAYFAETGGFSEDLEIMCERFRMVEDYA